MKLFKERRNMTVFRCAEDESRTGIHDTLEFLHVMVGNSIEETVAIVLPAGFKCMNQFLSTFIFYFYFVFNHSYNKIIKSSWFINYPDWSSSFCRSLA